MECPASLGGFGAVLQSGCPKVIEGAAAQLTSSSTGAAGNGFTDEFMVVDSRPTP